MAGVGEWLRGMFRTKPMFAGMETPRSVVPHPPVRPKSLVSFARGNNDFALALYGQLRQKPGNLFFSPFSIRTALGLAHAGARSETAAEMSKALSIGTHDEMANIGRLVERLTASGGTYEASVANSLWSQRGAPILVEFLDLIRPYRSELHQIDFRDGEGARTRINEWVSVETKQRIRDLVPPGGLDARTRLAIVNAVYFKGMWQVQFEPESTDETTFYLADGGRVSAALMHQRHDFGYLKGSGFQAVELLYKGADVSMVVFLPDQRGELSRVEGMLTPDLIQGCFASLQVRDVDVWLPRFKLNWGTENVIAHVATLGMRLALAQIRADFSGINGRRPPDPEALFINALFHHAFVEVNEEGTEAAGATAGMVTLSAYHSHPKVPVFRADHPFLFAIRERASGAILFLGRVTNPASAS